MVGLSQEALGEKLGITYQQLQKNEHGVNRIASSRLFDLSRILDVPNFEGESVPPRCFLKRG